VKMFVDFVSLVNLSRNFYFMFGFDGVSPLREAAHSKSWSIALSSCNSSRKCYFVFGFGGVSPFRLHGSKSEGSNAFHVSSSSAYPIACVNNSQNILSDK